MKSVFSKSKEIKKEADELLSQFKLVELLSQYGSVHITGSYDLDLMFKKDIDISLVNNNISVAEFSELGKELIDRLNTPSVYYRNTRITPVDKRPENSLYWGIRTGDWFIDIWAMNSEVYRRADSYIRKIKSQLTEERRLIILSLKEDMLKSNRYSREFGSRELYDAVLNYNVKDLSELNNYLSKLASNNIYL